MSKFVVSYYSEDDRLNDLIELELKEAATRAGRDIQIERLNDEEMIAIGNHRRLTQFKKDSTELKELKKSLSNLKEVLNKE